jgi:Ca2+-transporting ATPase
VSPPHQPPRPWAAPAEELCRALEVVPERGLDAAEAARRLRAHGPNQLRRTRRQSAVSMLGHQFRSVIIALLLIAGAAAFAFGEVLEGFAIGAVVVLNAALGFVTELRAVRSMEALRRLGHVSATVRRDGELVRVRAEELVPGDVVLVEGGDVVSADLRLVESSKLQADESMLSGESVPVGKGIEPIEGDPVPSERVNMLFKGSAVTRGSGAGIVVATGMATELGRISALVESAEQEATPLEQRLDALGRRLVWLTLAIALAVVLAGIARQRELLLMIETAIALAVATVPEGLPIVATLALARGMWRMARRNALIERLSAVETLGSTSVILTDKTGTLTENRMTAVEIALEGRRVEVEGRGLASRGRFLAEGEAIDPASDARLTALLRAALLCNNASLRAAEDGDDAVAVGDPTEVALLVLGAKAGLERDALLEHSPERREEAFDPELKMMATFHDEPGERGLLVAVKGAPEALLEVSTRMATEEGEVALEAEAREAWRKRAEEMGGRGLRVLALASRSVRDERAAPYEDLTLLGLVGLLDPPRERVREALEACRQAGIRVVVVTGDQAATARNVAGRLGLFETEDGERIVDARELPRDGSLPEEEEERLLAARLVARASPEQKLGLIDLYQRHGFVVAMTGDGVNDAPALKKADIGVAMGRRGTQVAKEAADMVLQDDELGSIVAAVEQGRTIFANIRKFVVYLLSCNVSEILVVALATLADAPLPILPLQILFLNLVTDVFPALALGVGEGEPALMRRGPRPASETVLQRRHWLAIGRHGSVITAAVLGAFALALHWLELDASRAVTVSFLTLAFAQLWHVFNMREHDSGRVRNEITRNPWVWGALALCTALLLAAMWVPVLAEVLAVASPGPEGWLLVAGMSALPLVAGQAWSFLPGADREAAQASSTRSRYSGISTG